MWEDDPIQTQSKCLPIPGRDVESHGITPFRDLTTEDQCVFDYYKYAISKKIRQESDVKFPEKFEFVPTSVAKQIEAPNNCYFRIDLPRSIVTVKIVPHPYVHDLSKHITLHRQSIVHHKSSDIELVL